MKHLTVLNLLGKLFYLGALFTFVHDESDYLLVPLQYSLATILSGVLAVIIILRRFGVRVMIPAYSTIIALLKDSTQFFLSRVSVSLYTSINTVVLGLFAGKDVVAYYTAAEKVFIAMRSAFSPIAQALYPYMTVKRNVVLFKKIYYLTLIAAFVMGSVVYLFSGSIVRIAFGPGMEQSATLLRIFALILPLAATSILLGYPLLAAMGYRKSVNVPLVIASFLHMALVALVVPVISPVNVALISLITEVAVVSMLVHQTRKHRLWHTVSPVSQ